MLISQFHVNWEAGALQETGWISRSLFRFTDLIWTRSNEFQNKKRKDLCNIRLHVRAFLWYYICRRQLSFITFKRQSRSHLARTKHEIIRYPYSSRIVISAQLFSLCVSESSRFCSSRWNWCDEGVKTLLLPWKHFTCTYHTSKIYKHTVSDCNYKYIELWDTDRLCILFQRWEKNSNKRH